MRRSLRWLLAAALLLLAWQVIRAIRVARFELSFFRARRWDVPPPPDSAALGLRDATFTAGATTLRGWYIPTKNGAAIVATHGSGGDRRDLLPEARLLAAAGYGVLLYDSPGHGQSDGTPRWGAPERAAVRAAVDYLLRQPDVGAERVGAYGFSLGGYVLAGAAADDPRIRAVALGGTPTDAIEQTRSEYRHAGPIAVFGALTAVRMSGMDVRTSRPIDVVASIAPRPLLLVGSSTDETVPVDMARQLFRAAREPKELLVLEGAAHGKYLEAAPEFGTRLRSFFDRALGPTGP
jgi:dipeptidyl aminopeptidase/acylaminoacyl peptidase